MTIKQYLGLGALAFLAACQTTAEVDYSQAINVIRAGAPDITVSPPPDRNYTRADGSTCQEFRYYQPGDKGRPLQGLAVVCRYRDQDWILVSRKLDPVPGKPGDGAPDTPPGKDWTPITGKGRS